MLCRLCLSESQDYLFIFNSHDGSCDGSEISKIILKYFQMELLTSDAISNIICQTCWHQLYDFHQFWLNIVQKQELMHQQQVIFNYDARPKIEEVQTDDDVKAISLYEPQIDALETKEIPLLSESSQSWEDEPDVLADPLPVKTTRTPMKRPQKTRYHNKKASEQRKSCRLMAKNDETNDILVSPAIERLPEVQLLHSDETLARKNNNSPRESNRSKLDKSNDDTDEMAEPMNITALSDQCNETKHETTDSGAKMVKLKRKVGRPPKLSKEKMEFKPIKENKLRKQIKHKEKRQTILDESTDESSPKKNAYDNRHSDTTVLLPHLIYTISEMDAYIAEHSQLRCSLCEEPLANFNVLKKHFRSVHKLNGYAICCQNRFLKRTLFVDHLKMHTNPEFFKCALCNKVLANRNCFYNHMATLHPQDEELKFQCTHCSRKFTKQYILDYHMKKHQEVTGAFNCNICQKGFKSAVLLSVHQKSVHFNKFSVMCDLCGKSFKNKQNFVKHKQSIHENIQVPEEQCQICGKWLKDKYNLHKHMYKHRDEASGKEYVCNECGIVKTTRQKLTSHIKYNHEYKTYKCTLCEKVCKRPRELQEHIATHTGKALYNCQFCTRTFKSHANMHNHKKKMHPNEWIRKYSRPTKPITVTNQNPQPSLSINENLINSIV